MNKTTVTIELTDKQIARAREMAGSLPRAHHPYDEIVAALPIEFQVGDWFTYEWSARNEAADRPHRIVEMSGDRVAATWLTIEGKLCANVFDVDWIRHNAKPISPPLAAGSDQ